MRQSGKERASAVHGAVSPAVGAGWPPAPGQDQDLAGREPAQPARHCLPTTVTFISLVAREWMRRRRQPAGLWPTGHIAARDEPDLAPLAEEIAEPDWAADPEWAAESEEPWRAMQLESRSQVGKTAQRKARFAAPMPNSDSHAAATVSGRRRASDRPGRVDCAVVIVTYDSARYIASLLESLPTAAAGLTVRAVVVDNGSTDATVRLVRAFPGVQCVENGANLGYAGGINVGREHAGDFAALLVLNPDAVLEAGALREMVAALDDPGVGIVAPMLLDADGRLYPSLRREPTLARAIGDALLGSRIGRRPDWLSVMVRDESRYCYRQAVDWATGAALLVSAACDHLVGRWDEGFFLYSEETDYAARARDAGFRIEYVPAARVRHRGGGSGQSGALRALNAVSRIRYVEKHGRWPRAHRAAVVLHELLRSANPGHRTALRYVLRRSRWPALIGNLQAATRNCQETGAAVWPN